MPEESTQSRLIREKGVFINCPFDDHYRPFFHAIVFTVIRSGFKARCALEADDSSENRLDKIQKIIAECRFGIHDLSRTEPDGDPPLPRFNMPLELGLFLGAKRYGTKRQKDKTCLIFDTEQYRFQRFISDLSGQDIHAHGGTLREVVVETAKWLRAQTHDPNIPGGAAIFGEYSAFVTALPQILKNVRIQPSEMTFVDFARTASQHIFRLQQP